MTVTPIEGEPFRFHVSSRSGAPDHLVDLAEYGFSGACACPHFQFRHAPLLREGAAPHPALRCAHIRAARDAFFDLVAPKLEVAMRENFQRTP